MNKPKLTILMNIPTPYQLDYFNRLKEHFELKVIYYSATESNRIWNLNIPNDYESIILTNPKVIKFIQTFFPSFHFNPKIITYLIKDKSKNIIIGGSYNSPNAILGLVIAKLTGKKVAFLGEALLSTKHPIKRLVKNVILLPLKLSVDGIIAVGSKAVNSYKTWGIKKPIFNIPYSIEGNRFDKINLNNDKLSQIEQEFNRPKYKILLFSGAIIHRKGVDLLLEIYKKIITTFPETKLLILGDGPQKNEFANQTKEYKNIHWLGFKEKEEIPYYFNIADIFVFPSRYDGWGLVINEACAAGLAIVGSKETGAILDMVKEGFNGFICNANSIDCFSNSINLLLSNEKLLKSYQANSKIIYSDFDSKSAAVKTVEIFCKQS